MAGEANDGDLGVLVAETRLGKFQVEARGASWAVLVDEPASVGGLGDGPNPYDLLCAALGSCTTMTLRLYADRKAWPLTRVQVRVSHKRGSLKERDQFLLSVTLEGDLDEEQKARLMEIAERCPVHMTLDRGADVHTTITVAAATTAASPADLKHMRDMDEACAS